MELRLGLALPASDDHALPRWLHSRGSVSSGLKMFESKKRSFVDAFFVHQDEEEDDHRSEESPRTLPLFHWDTQQPNGDDDRPGSRELDSAFASNKTVGLVGWPPIKNHRRKLINYYVQYHRNYNGAASGDHRARGRGFPPATGNSNLSNSKYVKVKMEGVAIARKVDLTLHHSFVTLKQTLCTMFGTSQENFGRYELTYQDREGDWLLAEDGVSWRTFIGLAQRLRLVKCSG